MAEARDVAQMTYAEYLAFEKASETKHEYVNGHVYAMAGGTLEHARLAARLAYLMTLALGGRPCAVFSSDARVRVEATGRSTYPDLSVVCGALVPAPDDPDAVTNPGVIFEVLSDSTEASDRGDKWSHCRIPSLREYVLVSQSARRLEVFQREGDHWRFSDAGPGGAIRLESLGVSLAVDDVYASSTG